MAFVASACALLAGCGSSVDVEREADGSSSGHVGGGGVGAAGMGAGPGTGAGGVGGVGGVGTGGGGGGSVRPVPEGCNIAFDPDQVYMFATLQEGAASRQAIALPEDPTNFCVGFEEAAPPVVRPSDHAVLYFGHAKYRSPDQVRVFSPDSITWNDSAGSWEYPEDATGNDDVLPTPPCASATWFLVGAQDGKLVFTCSGAGTIHTDDGLQFEPPSGGGYLLSYGHDDFKLGVSFYAPVLLDPLGTEITVPSIPWPDYELVTVRARVGGFWVVTTKADPSYVFQRWFVDFTGAATLEGTYSEPPAGVVAQLGGKLGGDGSYVWIAQDFDPPFHDVIVRSRLEPEASEVIYDESNGPRGFPDWTSHDAPGFYPKIHISYLFTGP